MATGGFEITQTDGLEIPGDLGWIALLVVLGAIAWRGGILNQPGARRAVLAGAGVALVAIPVMVLLQNVYSLPNAILAAIFYGPVVTVMLLVWFRDYVQNGVSA